MKENHALYGWDIRLLNRVVTRNCEDQANMKGLWDQNPDLHEHTSQGRVASPSMEAPGANIMSHKTMYQGLIANDDMVKAYKGLGRLYKTFFEDRVRDIKRA